MLSNYKFLEKEEKYKDLEYVPIQITEGKFKGVEFMLNEIKMNIEYNTKTKEERLHVSFDAKILNDAGYENISMDNKDFVDFAGNIVYDILAYNEEVTPELADQNVDQQVDMEADVHEDPHGKDHS
jgi:hypothetical protein